MTSLGRNQWERKNILKARAAWEANTAQQKEPSRTGEEKSILAEARNLIGSLSQFFDAKAEDKPQMQNTVDKLFLACCSELKSDDADGSSGQIKMNNFFAKKEFVVDSKKLTIDIGNLIKNKLQETGKMAVIDTLMTCVKNVFENAMNGKLTNTVFETMQFCGQWESQSKGSTSKDDVQNHDNVDAYLKPIWDDMCHLEAAGNLVALMSHTGSDIDENSVNLMLSAVNEVIKKDDIEKDDIIQGIALEIFKHFAETNLSEFPNKQTLLWNLLNLTTGNDDTQATQPIKGSFDSHVANSDFNATLYKNMLEVQLKKGPITFTSDKCNELFQNAADHASSTDGDEAAVYLDIMVLSALLSKRLDQSTFKETIVSSAKDLLKAVQWEDDAATANMLLFSLKLAWDGEPDQFRSVDQLKKRLARPLLSVGKDFKDLGSIPIDLLEPGNRNLLPHIQDGYVSELASGNENNADFFLRMLYRAVTGKDHHTTPKVSDPSGKGAKPLRHSWDTHGAEYGYSEVDSMRLLLDMQKEMDKLQNPDLSKVLLNQNDNAGRNILTVILDELNRISTDLSAKGMQSQITQNRNSINILTKMFHTLIDRGIPLRADHVDALKSMIQNTKIQTKEIAMGILTKEVERKAKEPNLVQITDLDGDDDGQEVSVPTVTQKTSKKPSLLATMFQALGEGSNPSVAQINKEELEGALSIFLEGFETKGDSESIDVNTLASLRDEKGRTLFHHIAKARSFALAKQGINLFLPQDGKTDLEILLNETDANNASALTVAIQEHDIIQSDNTVEDNIKDIVFNIRQLYAMHATSLNITGLTGHASEEGHPVSGTAPPSDMSETTRINVRPRQNEASSLGWATVSRGPQASDFDNDLSNRVHTSSETSLIFRISDATQRQIQAAEAATTAAEAKLLEALPTIRLNSLIQKIPDLRPNLLAIELKLPSEEEDAKEIATFKEDLTQVCQDMNINMNSVDDLLGGTQEAEKLIQAAANNMKGVDEILKKLQKDWSATELDVKAVAENLRGSLEDIETSFPKTILGRVPLLEVTSEQGISFKAGAIDENINIGDEIGKHLRSNQRLSDIFRGMQGSYWPASGRERIENAFQSKEWNPAIPKTITTVRSELNQIQQKANSLLDKARQKIQDHLKSIDIRTEDISYDNLMRSLMALEVDSEKIGSLEVQLNQDFRDPNMPNTTGTTTLQEGLRRIASGYVGTFIEQVETYNESEKKIGKEFEAELKDKMANAKIRYQYPLAVLGEIDTITDIETTAKDELQRQSGALNLLKLPEMAPHFQSASHGIIIDIAKHAVNQAIQVDFEQVIFKSEALRENYIKGDLSGEAFGQSLNNIEPLTDYINRMQQSLSGIYTDREVQFAQILQNEINETIDTAIATAKASLIEGRTAAVNLNNQLSELKANVDQSIQNVSLQDNIEETISRLGSEVKGKHLQAHTEFTRQLKEFKGEKSNLSRLEILPEWNKALHTEESNPSYKFIHNTIRDLKNLNNAKKTLNEKVDDLKAKTSFQEAIQKDNNQEDNQFVLQKQFESWQEEEFKDSFQRGIDAGGAIQKEAYLGILESDFNTEQEKLGAYLSNLEHLTKALFDFENKASKLVQEEMMKESPSVDNYLSEVSKTYVKIYDEAGVADRLKALNARHLNEIAERANAIKGAVPNILLEDIKRKNDLNTYKMASLSALKKFIEEGLKNGAIISEADAREIEYKSSQNFKDSVQDLPVNVMGNVNLSFTDEAKKITDQYVPLTNMIQDLSTPLREAFLRQATELKIELLRLPDDTIQALTVNELINGTDGIAGLTSRFNDAGESIISDLLTKYRPSNELFDLSNTCLNFHRDERMKAFVSAHVGRLLADIQGFQAPLEPGIALARLVDFNTTNTAMYREGGVLFDADIQFAQNRDNIFIGELRAEMDNIATIMGRADALITHQEDNSQIIDYHPRNDITLQTIPTNDLRAAHDKTMTAWQTVKEKIKEKEAALFVPEGEKPDHALIVELHNDISAILEQLSTFLKYIPIQEQYGPDAKAAAPDKHKFTEKQVAALIKLLKRKEVLPRAMVVLGRDNLLSNVSTMEQLIIDMPNSRYSPEQQQRLRDDLRRAFDPTATVQLSKLLEEMNKTMAKLDAEKRVNVENQIWHAGLAAASAA